MTRLRFAFFPHLRSASQELPAWLGPPAIPGKINPTGMSASRLKIDRNKRFWPGCLSWGFSSQGLAGAFSTRVSRGLKPQQACEPPSFWKSARETLPEDV